jgi:hypothetical protein
MFFLQSRTEQIKTKFKKAEEGISALKKAIGINPAGEVKKLSEGLKQYSQPIANIIRTHNNNMTKLNSATQSFTGYFKSFFCPWTDPFKYRKEAATSISIIEKNFHQFSLFARKSDVYLHPEAAPGNVKTSASSHIPKPSIENFMKKKT